MMGHFFRQFRDLDWNMENKGEELVITVKGDKEKLAAMERKLHALKELCCGEQDCC